MTRIATIWTSVAGAVLLAGASPAGAAEDVLSPGVSDLAGRLGTTILAVGALGTAAFGIVDGLKMIPWIDLAGFERLFSRRVARGGRRWPTVIRGNLDPLMPALELAYGADVIEVLKAQYRSARGQGDLPRTLRQGTRIGLGLMSEADVARLAQALGLPPDTARTVGRVLVATRDVRPPALGQAAVPPMPAVTADDRAALARLETAIDARIDAALVLAETLYVTQTKLVASVVALGIAIGVGAMLHASWPLRIIVGLAAVPLAPVAHDAATAIQQAVKAFGSGRAR